METEKKLESKVFFSRELKTHINAKTFMVTDYVEGEHRQDCCELVYIDFEHIDTYRNMIDAIGTITKIELATAPEDGFIFYIYNKDGDRYGIYLPCRNEQNGYYGDALTLTLKIDGITETFELQEMGCVENIIN